MASGQHVGRGGPSRLIWQLATLLGVSIALSCVFPSTGPANAAIWTQGTFTTSATVSAVNASAGDTVTVTARLTSTAATSVLVDLELYDPAGVRRSQTVYDDEPFAAGVERVFTTTWTLLNDAASGGYTVKVGVFRPNWGVNVHWNDAASFFTVGMGTPPPDLPVRIMPLGDSLTDGFAVEGGYRIDLWTSLTSAGHSFDFVGSKYNGRPALGDKNHEGHSGWRIDHLAGAIDPWLAAYRPQIVLLMIGTNDMIENYNVGSAPTRLGALIDQIRASLPDAYIVVSSIPRNLDTATHTRIQTYNAAIPGVLATRGSRVSFVDGYLAIRATDLDPDGTHLTATGYSHLAGAWYPTVHALLNTLSPPPVSCTPRPRVAVAVAKDGAGHLTATIAATGANNTLREIRIGDARNARVDVGGQSGIGGFTVPLPANPTSVALTVSRLTAGAGVHVPLTVVDRCGDWPTFVGAGPAAF
ncbi:MAG: SGNH/GDSL hydrolase family protein [Chloroflexota bacterium]